MPITDNRICHPRPQRPRDPTSVHAYAYTPTRPHAQTQTTQSKSTGATFRRCRSPSPAEFHTPPLPSHVHHIPSWSNIAIAPCHLHLTIALLPHPPPPNRPRVLIQPSYHHSLNVVYTHSQPACAVLKQSPSSADPIRLHRPTLTTRNQSQDGETILSALQETSSKLCSTLKPIADRQSKWPSPSI